LIVDCKDFPTALKIAEVDWKKKSKKSKPTNFQEATEIMCDAMKLMIISKNHKYGKNNILKFGQQGIFMRDWDKICRLEEGIIKGKDLGEEGLMETWADNAGYSLVAMLLEKDWYKLPVELGLNNT
jgi:hypothetical protein